ncbi:methylated-DNA--[protein]-cysteine S-methyltransferase [Marinicrinis lubricantis]|uniref:Methylated-DNA--protein-cysteine methyltransferase n=1 Tax=Marinicrinis lubricantis TaxID=2086470 RepID=A0ABW1IRG4_9BACL
MKRYACEMSSPIGTLTLISTDKGICSIEFCSFEEYVQRLSAFNPAEAFDQDTVEKAPQAGLLQAAVLQLEQYFSGKRKIFDLSLDLSGTDFQRKVWRALMDIPYGETRSYQDIAGAVGNLKAVRAVGGANNRNPVPIIVPCHRVIGKNGSMVGYGGGLYIKETLLALEGWKRFVS